MLLAWGTDLVRVDGRWSNAKARGCKRGSHVRNPYQLRLNAYRVLLTRGRDATVVFVPPLPELDETLGARRKQFAPVEPTDGGIILARVVCCGGRD